MIEASVRRHRLWAPGTRLAIAVSGGADSVGLLQLAVESADAWGVVLSVAHLDHGFRATSGADAAFVADLARQHGLRLWRARAPRAPRAGDNHEQLGRRWRLAFFTKLVRSQRVDRVATAHTADDQAETVLMRVLRGAGPAGLAGILPLRPPGIVRPLLEVRRSQLRQFAQERGLGWREDATNADLTRLRNRVRHEILPGLACLNPQLAERLCSLAELARGEEEYWQATTGTLGNEIWHEGPPGVWSAERGRLRALPLGLRRRLLREGVRRAQGDLRQLDYPAIERLAAALDSPPAGPHDYRLAGTAARLNTRELRLQLRRKL